jgi:hypothetical protein
MAYDQALSNSPWMRTGGGCANPLEILEMITLFESSPRPDLPKALSEQRARALPHFRIQHHRHAPPPSRWLDGYPIRRALLSGPR